MIGRFMPHGMCFAWRTDVLLLHVISDGLIALAYFSIPVVLFSLVYKRRDLPFMPVLLMFGSFIIACGLTHVMAIWTVWHPDYWVDGALKAFTAAISLVTAATMVPLLPKFLALRSPLELEVLNAELAETVRHLQVADAETQATLEHLDEGVVVFGPDMRVLRHNPAAERILRTESATIQSWDIEDLRRLVDAPHMKVEASLRPVQRALATGEPQLDLDLQVFEDATLGKRWLAASAIPVTTSALTAPDRVVLCVRDVTRYKSNELEQRGYARQLRALHTISSGTSQKSGERVQEALRLALEELRLECGYLGIIDRVTNEVVVTTVVDRLASRLVVVGRRMPVDETVVAAMETSEDVVAFHDVTKTRETVRKTVDDACGSLIAVPIRVGGKLHGVIGFLGRTVRERPFTQTNVEFVQVTGDLVASSIERQLQRERLDALAFKDNLTGLYNRVVLMDRLQQCIETAKRHEMRFALYFIDLDGFKSVNDTLGHAAGDELLKEVAARLSDVVRKGDTVARLGGDEFIVLAPHMKSAADAAELGQRLIAGACRPFEIDGKNVVPSASVGISLFPQHGLEADALIASADRAMFDAKMLGKGCARFVNESARLNA